MLLLRPIIPDHADADPVVLGSRIRDAIQRRALGSTSTLTGEFWSSVVAWVAAAADEFAITRSADLMNLDSSATVQRDRYASSPFFATSSLPPRHGGSYGLLGAG